MCGADWPSHRDRLKRFPRLGGTSSVRNQIHAEHDPGCYSYLMRAPPLLRILLLLAVLVPSANEAFARVSTTGAPVVSAAEVASSEQEECCPTNCACDCPCGCSRSMCLYSVLISSALEQMLQAARPRLSSERRPVEVYLDLTPPPRA
jgi:hypothetical protein